MPRFNERGEILTDPQSNLPRTIITPRQRTNLLRSIIVGIIAIFVLVSVGSFIVDASGKRNDNSESQPNVSLSANELIASATNPHVPYPSLSPTISQEINFFSTPTAVVIGVTTNIVPSDAQASSEKIALSDGMIQIWIDKFWVDKTEVTNRMYALCVDAGHCKQPGNPSPPNMTQYFGVPSYDNYPAVRVDYSSAVDYCRWVGRRLPTAAEWQQAAGIGFGYTYPWGFDYPTCNHANFNDNNNYCVGSIAAGGMRLLGGSPYGLLDMAGNAAEWVFDMCGSNRHNLYGGSWNDSAERMQINNPWCRDDNSISTKIGFRCLEE